MAGIALPLQIASVGLSVLGQARQGAADASAAKAAAARQEARAKQVRAAAQRRAIAAKRQSDIAKSNFLARASATGGGADRSTTATLAKIDGEGEFNALNAIADGELAARDSEFAAGQSRFRAKQKRADTALGVLQQGTSFAAKYAPEFTRRS